ncbi:MAG TPA: ROK family protein [Candidatus Eremiobacteraceae bacterium]
MPALAVDLGGTFLRCAVVSGAGNISDVLTERIDRHPRDPESLWRKIFDRIEAVAAASHAELGPADPIAFAFPGPVADRSRILGAPTVIGPTAELPDVVQILRERTGRPVYLLNDVSAAAWYYLNEIQAARFMVVTVSSGIGSKLVNRADSAKVMDAWPYAGEIGHVVVDFSPDAPMCDCGGSGHLGAIASGRGTENLAQRMSKLNAAAFDASLCVTSFGATQSHFTNEDHLVPAARLGDPWAWDLISTTQGPLAQVLAALIVAASLENVLIIGGFAISLGDRYLACLREAVQRRIAGLIELPVDDVIHFGQSAGEACLRGAGLFAESVARSAR